MKKRTDILKTNKPTPSEAIEKTTGVKPKKKEPTKKPYGVYMAPETYKKLQAISYWDRESLGEVVRQALDEHIKKREKARGEPYPPKPKK